MRSQPVVALGSIQELGVGQHRVTVEPTRMHERGELVGVDGLLTPEEASDARFAAASERQAVSGLSPS